MSEALDYYQQQAKAGLSTIPWLAELQAEGLRQLEHHGFPTRHHEDWKYTLVDTFLQQRFAKKKGKQATEGRDAHTPPYQALVSNVNGQAIVNKKLLSQLPAGVIVQPLAEAILHHEEMIKSHLGKVLQHEHGFQALNTAMIESGVFLLIPAGVCIEHPLFLAHWQGEENQALFNRCLIIVEEGSQVSIVEDYRGAEGCPYFTNTITEVFAAKRSKITHYKIQREGKKAYHVGHLSAQLATDAQLASHSLSLGARLGRSDLSVYLQEENSQCLLNGIYVPTSFQHLDHHTTVNHLVPNCKSEQDYKGILMGRSRAVFNGKVFVAKDAQHTDARQQNKNLLLSQHAEIDTKPQLDIFADDVICTHGATVGQLDEEALFYLAARGIDRQEASSYLIHAFTTDNLRLVPDQSLAVWLTILLNEQLR